MPIFEFHCPDCGADFEKLVFSGDPAVECPQCHGTNCEKLLSACNAKVGNRLTATSGGSCTSCTATTCSSCH